MRNKPLLPKWLIDDHWNKLMRINYDVDESGAAGQGQTYIHGLEGSQPRRTSVCPLPKPTLKILCPPPKTHLKKEKFNNYIQD